MAEAITDPQLRAFVHSNISKSFGLSVETVAVKCKNWGRFKSWLSSDVNRIIKVLNVVKNNGVSPAFFAAYERTEGYNSKWGWLNHTRIKVSPEEDADYVSKWIVSQSKNTTDRPAWIDFANYKDFVPDSVKQAGNNDFTNMTLGSIGKVVIAGTAAATWEVYYPDGLKKEFNGVQNYAKPITVMMNSIIEWGGSMDNDNPNPDPDPDPEPDPDPRPDPPSIDFDLITNFFGNFSKELIEKIEKMLIVNLYDYGKSQTFGNSFVKVDKTFSNTYKIKPTLNFNKIIDELIDSAKDNILGIIGSINPDVKPDPEPDVDENPNPDPDPEPDGEKYFPVDYSKGGINFWHPPYTKGSVQEGMDFGGPRSSGVLHAGYDIGAGGVRGNKVYSIKSGKVTFVGNEGTRGFVIRIRQVDGKHVMYMHLVVNSNKVKIGDNVKAGQEIAVMGDTPNGMYSIHLHVEIDDTGKFEGYAKQDNPRTYLEVTGNNKTSLPNPAKK